MSLRVGRGTPLVEGATDRRAAISPEPVRKHSEPSPDRALEESRATSGVAAWHRHVQNCDARSRLGRVPWHRGVGSTSGASVGYRAVRRRRELAQKVLNETPAWRSGPRDVPCHVDVHDGILPDPASWPGSWLSRPRFGPGGAVCHLASVHPVTVRHRLRRTAYWTVAISEMTVSCSARPLSRGTENGATAR